MNDNNNKLNVGELNYLIDILNLQENRLNNELLNGVTSDRARDIVRELDRIKSIVTKATYSDLGL